jgi:CrcB protein
VTSDHSAEHAPRPGDSTGHWPVDTDVDVEPAGVRLRGRTSAVVLAGGIVGGLTRYEVVKSWHTAPAGFPWPTFAVNTAGAFVLGFLVVLVLEVLPPTRYLRPLVGTGFCGALTTFSSVAVEVDERAAHGHIGTGAAYLGLSLAAGGLAALAGLLAGRMLPSMRSHRGRLR